MVRDKFSNFQLTRKQTEKYENGNKQQKESNLWNFRTNKTKQFKNFF
jgi:hypothetical protein